MADGSITFSTALDNRQLEKDLAKLKKDIEKTKKTIAELTNKRGEAANASVFKAGELDAEKAKLQEIKDRLQDIRNLSKDKSISVDSRATYTGMLPNVRTELADQQTRVRMLQAEYNKIDNSVLRYDEKLKSANATLEEQTIRAGQLAQQIDAANGVSAKMGKAISEAGERMSNLNSRIAKLAINTFVFTLIVKALRALRTWISDVIKGNDEARAAIARLKGALLTLAQPIVNVVIPAFTKLVNILAKITAMAANVVSRLFGTTASASADAAENLYNEVNAIEGVGEVAEEAAGSLAGFDEINTISTENSSSGAGAGAADDTIAPDFSGVIDEKLGAIEAVVGGALLALGAILAFSGVNIPLGITLMALGALTLAAVVKDNWDAISQALQGPIGVITALLSTALLVIGAILTFSGGNIGLGIGLMILGAVGLAATVAANWNTIVQALQGPLGVLVGILGAALLVIGAILTFTGANLPLGIGLMIAGAAGLAATVGVNWDTISQALQGPIGAVIATLSAALLVLGAILVFTGANIPLGIGMLVIGAAGLATTIAANWNAIPELLQGPIGIITGIVSAALLVLGAILTFTGANIPLGIGLLIAGAVGLAATVAVNWETIQGLLQGPVGAVTGIISAALLVLGVILLFTGAGIPLGLGLIAAGAVGLAAAIAPNWDYILEKLKGCWNAITSWWNTSVKPKLEAIKIFFKGCIINPLLSLVEGFINFFISGLNWLISQINKISFEVPDWVPGIGGKTLGFNLKSVEKVALPRLATGAVIPPNREFLAVLGDQKSGTNIEAPLSTIEQALENVLARTGGMGGDINITVESVLDGKVVARNTVKHINDMTRQAGTPVLLF